MYPWERLFDIQSIKERHCVPCLPIGAQHIGRPLHVVQLHGTPLRLKVSGQTSVQVQRFDRSGAAVTCCCRMQRRRGLHLVPNANACKLAATWGSLRQLSDTKSYMLGVLTAHNVASSCAPRICCAQVKPSDEGFLAQLQLSSWLCMLQKMSRKQQHWL